jgi:hypothetical protein
MILERSPAVVAPIQRMIPMPLAIALDLGNGSGSVNNATSPLVRRRRYPQHFVDDLF